MEELYDTQADPYEIHNLARDASREPELTRLRDALDSWLREVGDMGRIPEAEMVRLWYPNGKRPVTAAPIFVPICKGNPGLEPAQEGGAFNPPVLVQIHCATQGASIAYTFEQDPNPHWLLYSTPLLLPSGKTALRAKATRIGYQESAETTATFLVQPADQVDSRGRST